MVRRRRNKFHILNLRGCNGSGKSWVVRQLLEHTLAKPIYSEPEAGRLLGRVIGHHGDYEGKPIYFVGSYEIMTGGADSLMKQFNGLDTVCNVVRKFAGKGHVVFEGFIVSGLFYRFYELSKEIGGITWCYLDTPLKVCYQRIEARNREKSATRGRIRGSMGTKHVEQKFNECIRTQRKAKEAGEKVIVLDHRRPMKAIHKILRG